MLIRFILDCRRIENGGIIENHGFLFIFFIFVDDIILQGILILLLLLLLLLLSGIIFIISIGRKNFL